jgi:hypothetical protein
MKEKHLLGLVIGIPSIAWLYTLTSFSITLAIFLCLFANNLSQSKN